MCNVLWNFLEHNIQNLSPPKSILFKKCRFLKKTKKIFQTKSCLRYLKLPTVDNTISKWFQKHKFIFFFQEVFFSQHKNDHLQRKTNNSMFCYTNLKVLTIMFKNVYEWHIIERVIDCYIISKTIVWCHFFSCLNF